MTFTNLSELIIYFRFKNNKLPYYLQHLPFHDNTNTYTHTIKKTQQNIYQLKPNHEYAK